MPDTLWKLIDTHGFPEIDIPVYILIEDDMLSEEGHYPVVEEAVLKYTQSGNPEVQWIVSNPFDNTQDFVLQSETVHAWRYKNEE